MCTVLLGTLYRSDDPGRAYYGTDTRGASLLIGAGLAVILARHWTDGGDPGLERLPSRLGRIMLGGFAGLAVLVLAWAWTQADGGDTRLYRGGLVFVALAVAVLLAHVVLVPRGWSARLLSWTPLVLVGRISYGIYLWHWPVFIALNADRTGRQGVELFALRCAVTLGVAVLSYLLVERPIRYGGLLRRPGVVVNGGVALAGVGTVAALVLVTTAVQAPRLAEAGLAGPEGLAAANGIDRIGSVPSTALEKSPDQIHPGFNSGASRKGR